jgi:tRNA threonylcarbamoyladenosine biosynthesis protein TsaE
MLTYPLPEVEFTLKLGAQCAALCPKQCVFFLRGPLGAGKTTFARGFLQALGEFKRIKSPTYTVVETYQIASRSILHFDLYRLQDPDELEALGIRDYTLSPAIWLIEWPERAQVHGEYTLLPAPDLTLHFELLPAQHQLKVESHTSVGHQLSSQLNRTRFSADFTDHD